MGAANSKDIEDIGGSCECSDPCYNKNMLGTVKMYHRHVLLCTPAQQPSNVLDSWKEYPKIESEEGSFAATFKKLISNSNIVESSRQMITACTLPSLGPEGTQDVVVFPEQLRYTFSKEDTKSLEIFVQKQLREQVPADELSPKPFTEAKRLVLVCTHDARDRRCGKIGTQTYYTLRHNLEDRNIPESEVTVVESSHIGGHKYAGVLIVYPDGHWLGQVSEKDVDRVIDGYLNTPLTGPGVFPSIPVSLADKFRGQIGYSKDDTVALLKNKSKKDTTDAAASSDKEQSQL